MQDIILMVKMWAGLSESGREELKRRVGPDYRKLLEYIEEVERRALEKREQEQMRENG